MMQDWPIAKFGDVLTTVSRPVAVKATTDYQVLGMRWYAQGLFVKEVKSGNEIRATELYRVETGDFVYNRLFAWKGSFGIAEADTAGGCVSGEFPVFRVNTEQAYPKYLHFYLSQERIWNEIERNSTGQTNISRLRLKEPDFLAMEIPLPPLNEQHRLVARIEALAAKIEEARGLRRLAVEEAEALVKSNLSRVYVALDGTIQSLGDYAVQITDGPHVTPNYVETGFPFVTVRNIANRRLDLRNLKYVTKEDHEMFCKRAKPERGDVLYTKDGTLGTPCYVDTDKEFSFFVSVALIKPKRDLLDGRYLTYILDTPQVHDQVTQNKTGAVLAHIVLRAIKAIQIPVPSLEEQRHIVAYLDGLQGKVDALKALQSQTQAELDALLPSVLDKAFKGEL